MKYQVFLCSKSCLLLRNVQQTVSKYEMGIFDSTFISEISHWLDTWDGHALSTGHLGKVWVCSNLCYLWPNFLVFSTRGLAFKEKEIDSLSCVSREGPWDHMISLWVSLLCQVPWYYSGHGSFSRDHLLTYKSRVSFLLLTFKKEDKHKNVLSVGLIITRANLFH